MANIKHTSDATFQTDVLDSKGFTLVDFWAVWCTPCQMLAPQLEIVAKDFDGKLTVVKLDTDANRETAMKYQIMGIPTLILFKDGKPIMQNSGFMPASSLSAWLKSNGVN
jgi:thioredoxin 1